MTITRIIDGQSVDIELTSEELYQAYDEQKFQNLLFDVKLELGNYLEGDEYLALSENDDFINTVTEEVRETLDYTGLSFEYALDNAIGNNKEDYLKEEDL